MNTFLADILAQPAALCQVLQEKTTLEMAEIDAGAQLLSASPRIVLTSMGSALYSLMPMAHALAAVHPNVHLVETAELMRAPLFPATLYVIMSRSGESGEIKEFSNTLNAQGKPLIAITMTRTSTLAKNASLVIGDSAPYDGFICTKAYTSLALIGLLLVSRWRDELSPALISQIGSSFDWMEGNQKSILSSIEGIAWLGSSLTFLARGAGMGLAQAGALWLEEAARVRASFSSFAAFRHGPIEQIDERFRGVWIDLTPDAETRRMQNEFFAHGGNWLSIGEVTAPHPGVALPDFDLPQVYKIIPGAMPVQLVAYQSAKNLGVSAGEMRYLNWVIQ